MISKTKNYQMARSLSLVGIWISSLIFGQLAIASQTDVMLRTLQVLTHQFDTQSPQVQKKVLRQIGLMQMQESVNFLIQTALSSKRYTVDVRRDALKSMLSLDNQHYRSVLLVLKTVDQKIDEKLLLETIGQISARDYYVQGWIGAVDFQEPSWMLENKMNHIYRYVKNGGKLDRVWFEGWDRDKAKTYFKTKTQKPATSASQTWQKIQTHL